MGKKIYMPANFIDDVGKLASLISDADTMSSQMFREKGYSGIYGIPRTGIYLAIALSEKLNLPLLQSPEKESLIVDAIVDTGVSRDQYPENDFACLHVTEMCKPENSITYAVHVGVKEPIQYWWDGIYNDMQQIEIREPSKEELLKVINEVPEVEPPKIEFMEYPLAFDNGTWGHIYISFPLTEDEHKRLTKQLEYYLSIWNVQNKRINNGSE